MSLKRIRTAIIGYGYMGEIRRSAISRSDAYDLVAIVEKKPRPTDLPQQIEWTSDVEAILRKSDIGAVFVCTPNHLIPSLTVAALNAGKHVFCEKPPGRTVEDVLSMRSAESAANGSVLMFGFNHRFHPAMQEAAQIIHDGRLGALRWLKGTYGKAGGKNFLSSWRNDKNVSGGGILLDQGIHMLDLFRFFAGDFDEIKAFCGNAYWDLPVEDNAFVILRNRNGVMGQLHSCASLWKHTFRIEMGLTEGYLNVEGFLSKTGSYNRETLTIGHREFEDETRAMGNPREERYFYEKDRSWDIEVDNFASAIRAGKCEFACSSHDALRVMQLIYAAYADASKKLLTQEG